MHTEQNIAALLHFAGCTLASLHPDPLSDFTVREIATEADDGDGGTSSRPSVNTSTPSGDDQQEAKLADFAKYAEGYYATLNVRFTRPPPCSPRGGPFLQNPL